MVLTKQEHQNDNACEACKCAKLPSLINEKAIVHGLIPLLPLPTSNKKWGNYSWHYEFVRSGKVLVKNARILYENLHPTYEILMGGRF